MIAQCLSLIRGCEQSLACVQNLQVLKSLTNLFTISFRKAPSLISNEEDLAALRPDSLTGGGGGGSRGEVRGRALGFVCPVSEGSLAASKPESDKS